MLLAHASGAGRPVGVATASAEGRGGGSPTRRVAIAIVQACRPNDGDARPSRLRPALAGARARPLSIRSTRYGPLRGPPRTLRGGEYLKKEFAFWGALLEHRVRDRHPHGRKPIRDSVERSEIEPGPPQGCACRKNSGPCVLLGTNRVAAVATVGASCAHPRVVHSSATITAAILSF